MERNDDVYYFAEHARQLVGADDFRRMAFERHTYREYQQWFSYHLLDGWGNITTRTSNISTVVMVGPVRTLSDHRWCACARKSLTLHSATSV
eukprot:SAG31_NODE_888_length_11219_cov_5.584712_8_plen_92_part_00